MSLKAKLEAVIYAAEEPVTLAQLSVLFADEALAWKAEEAARFAEAARNAESDAEPSESEPEPEQAVEETTETPGEVELEARLPFHPGEDPELEARRLAKARDREVREILRTQIDQLLAEYTSEDRGLEIREIAGGYRMATKPECHDAVRSFVKSLKPALKLSLPALETLAVIAYKQPVTAPEVGEIRGVDSAGVLGSLMSRKLITTAGRKQVVGRPMLYKTTKEFLLRFGLKDLSELPSMEEFEKLAAVELSDSEETGELDFSAGESQEEAVESDVLEASDAPEPATPTAASSPEPAEAHAPVERPDEVEIEAEP